MSGQKEKKKLLQDEHECYIKRCFQVNQGTEMP